MFAENGKIGETSLGMRLLEDAQKFSCKDRHERSYKELVRQYKIYSSYASYHRRGIEYAAQSRYREQKVI